MLLSSEASRGWKPAFGSHYQTCSKQLEAIKVEQSERTLYVVVGQGEWRSVPHNSGSASKSLLKLLWHQPVQTDIYWERNPDPRTAATLNTNQMSKHSVSYIKFFLVWEPFNTCCYISPSGNAGSCSVEIEGQWTVEVALGCDKSRNSQSAWNLSTSGWKGEGAVWIRLARRHFN